MPFNEDEINMLWGHAADDITKHIYTHRKINSLKKKIDKINHI